MAVLLVLRVLLAVIAAGWVWMLQPWRLAQAWTAGSSSSFRVLLVADPQMEGEGHTAQSRANARFNDHYLRSALWRGAVLGRATHVAMLGDVFSYQFLDELSFRERRERYEWALRAVGGLPVVTLAGNHDIGYGAEQSDGARARWEKQVGPLRGQMRLGEQHELVWLNAMVLDNGDADEAARSEWAFVARAKKDAAGRAVVLLIHVPLHKAAGSCPGDRPQLRREASGRVAEQTLLSEESSARLLKELDPVAVFSGHDHEGCRHGREVTLTAVQAEYWGHAMLYHGGGAGEAVPLWGMHNTPTIVLCIASLVWPLLWTAVRCIVWCCCSGSAAAKVKLF